MMPREQRSEEAGIFREHSRCEAEEAGLASQWLGAERATLGWAGENLHKPSLQFITHRVMNSNPATSPPISLGSPLFILEFQLLPTLYTLAEGQQNILTSRYQLQAEIQRELRQLS